MAVPKIEQRTFAQLQMVDVLAVGEVKRCMEVVQCEREPGRTSKRTVEQTDVYTLSSAEDGTWAFAVAKFSGSCCSRANLSVAFQFVRTWCASGGASGGHPLHSRVLCSLLCVGKVRRGLTTPFRSVMATRRKEGFPDLRCERVGRELSSLSSSLSKWSFQVIHAPALVISSSSFYFSKF